MEARLLGRTAAHGVGGCCCPGEVTLGAHHRVEEAPGVSWSLCGAYPLVQGAAVADGWLDIHSGERVSLGVVERATVTPVWEGTDAEVNLCPA